MNWLKSDMSKACGAQDGHVNWWNSPGLSAIGTGWIEEHGPCLEEQPQLSISQLGTNRSIVQVCQVNWFFKRQHPIFKWNFVDTWFKFFQTLWEPTCIGQAKRSKGHSQPVGPLFATCDLSIKTNENKHKDFPLYPDSAEPLVILQALSPHSHL